MNWTGDRSSTIIVFDTDCVVCSAWVHFILRHERDQKIKFVSAWSNEGMGLATRHGLTVDDLDATYLVVEDGCGLVRSDAGLALIGTSPCLGALFVFCLSFLVRSATSSTRSSLAIATAGSAIAKTASYRLRARATGSSTARGQRRVLHFKTSPPAGRSENRAIGFGNRSHASGTMRCSTVAITRPVSIRPKFCPMQTRGPAPKGK